MNNEDKTPDQPVRLLMVFGTTPAEVTSYLPCGYNVLGILDGDVLVAGRDVAGWTMDGYVIPRLQSGWLNSKEIKLP